MLKIMVVDDEKGACSIVEKTFSYMGYSVISLTDANTVMDSIKKDKPSIIFLDIMMPDVDGMDLLKQIKAVDRNIIVVMLTSKTDDWTREKAIEIGADDFIRKPFNSNDLRDIVLLRIQGDIAKRGENGKPTILIVEDDEKLADEIVKFVSKRYEAEILKAGDGRVAMDIIKNKKPDIILTDIKMPFLTGMELIDKTKDFSPETKVIVISAYGDFHIALQGKDNVIGYVSKPFSFVDIQRKLQPILLSKGKLVIKDSSSA